MMSPVFDPETHKMKPRFCVRGAFDKDRIYCIAEKGTRDEVVRIMVSNDHDVLHLEGIYESANSKILTIEPDAEHFA